MSLRIFEVVLSALLFSGLCASTPKPVGCAKEGLIDLTLTVIGAHVKKSDIITGSDPYTRVSIGFESMRTTSKSNTNTPTWNEALEFPCTNATSALQVMVLDYDFVGADDLLLEANWADWAAETSPTTKRLYNHDKKGSSYWVDVLANFSFAPAVEVCPATCMGYTCTEIDDKYGVLDGVCDKGGLELEENFGCSCNACACSVQSTCSETFSLSMYAESSKGWQGSFWEWRARNGALLDTGTLAEGGEGSADLCTFRNAFDCYELTVNDIGDEPEGATWKMTRPGTPKALLAHGGAPGFATVCTDDLCDETLLVVELHDRAGDGWNGNELKIYDCAGELLVPGLTTSKGRYNNTLTQCVATSRDGYFIVVTGGISGDDEVSWKVSTKSDGIIIAEGGALFAAGTCEKDPTLGDDDATTCDHECLGFTCDKFDAMYGFYDGVCDYYGNNLETGTTPCDCSGCSCLQGKASDECARSYTLTMRCVHLTPNPLINPPLSRPIL
jgi:hypothetical protein